MAVLVELDIFSGRPNPQWLLDEPTGRQLVDLHHRLQPTAERPPDPPGLGYRGFVYAVDDSTWRAFKGFVAAPGHVLADPESTIERWLIDQLPAEYLDLRPRIASEIGPTG